MKRKSITCIYDVVTYNLGLFMFYQINNLCKNFSRIWQHWKNDVFFIQRSI